VGLVTPRLTAANHREILEAACGKTRAEVAELLARLYPRPDVASTIRKVPARPATPAPLGLNPVAVPPVLAPVPRPTVVEPLAADRYHVHQTIDRETKDLLVLAKDLLPDCTDGEILKRALRLLTQAEERRKFAVTDKPRPAKEADPGSRYVPAAVRREVYARHGRQCAYVSPAGHRCVQRRRIELHHVRPYAAGGPTVASNLQPRCKLHNQYEADRYFDRQQREAALDLLCRGETGGVRAAAT
jgi:hypothetical protein